MLYHTPYLVELFSMFSPHYNHHGRTRKGAWGLAVWPEADMTRNTPLTTGSDHDLEHDADSTQHFVSQM